MERIEPSFVPEWYKGSNSNSSTGGVNSIHQSSISLQSDEHSINFSSRSRSSASISDHDASRTFSASERIPFFVQRKTSSNGYNEHHKDSFFHAHNSFSRNHRDKDKDREKNLKLYDNGLDGHANASISSKYEKDSLRNTQKTLLEKRADPWLKRSSHDLITGKIRGINKSSFDREFPSLRNDERYSLCSSTAICKLPVSSLAMSGNDGWTSVLAEVPNVGENSLVVSSSSLHSSTSRLNMAETVAQAPARVQAVSQLPGSNFQKIEELQRQQLLKLRPVTSSMPKNMGMNVAETSKGKGYKIAEHVTAKAVGQPVPSQLPNNTFRSNINLETPKMAQSGNFCILNREKNGVYVTSNPPMAISQLKGQQSPSFNSNGRAGATTSSVLGEKKLPSQTQNRIEFFNSLRKKTNSIQDSTNQNLNSNHPEAPNLMFTKEINDCKSVSSLLTNFHNCKMAEEVQKPVTDEEEVAFLRSLGWEENAGEEALTPEEIESFLSEYENRMPASKLKISGSSSRPSSSSDAEAPVDEASLC